MGSSLILGVDSYCDIGDIQRLTQQTYHDSNTKPSIGDVDDFAQNRFEELNGVLEAAGYDTPVDTAYPRASRILKSLNAKAAAADAEHARLSPAASGASGQTVSERAKGWVKEFHDACKAISSGAMSLIDAPRGSNTVTLKSDRAPDGAFNPDATTGEEAAPLIDRDTTF